MSVDSKLFAELRDRWREETIVTSNVTMKSINQNYQQVIGMGAVAVPYILRDLIENGPDDWFWALTSITRENPITEDIAGNMKAMTVAWIRWGKDRGIITEDI